MYPFIQFPSRAVLAGAEIDGWHRILLVLLINFSEKKRGNLSVKLSVSDPDPWNPYHFTGSGSV